METPITKYINDEGYLYIDDFNWRLLKQQYDKEKLIEFFITEVKEKRLLFPYKKITLKDAESDFRELMYYTPNDYFQAASYKVDYKYPSKGKYIMEKTFPFAPDYFQQKNRMNCGYISFPSPIEVFNTEKNLKRLFDGFFVFENKSVSSEGILSLIQLRFYVASKFKCAVAKSIYEKFNSVDVLDLSSGWGDRLCGFYACENTRSYIGIDPNTDTYNQYFKQAEFYDKCIATDTNMLRDTTPKKIRLFNLPAEDVQLEENIVDTVFTSPPYFNIERYTKEDNQSCNRYKTDEAWLNGFMFRAIDVGWKALKKGGYFLLNIADRADIRVCDRINDYFKSIGGTYIDCIGMQLSKRPNQRFEVDDTLCEPIWVWRK